MAGKFSDKDFKALSAKCKPALEEALENEISETTIKADPKSDLWDLPAVDSKTVCKIAPVFEELTGHKLKVKWVKKGGYDGVAEAITDLMNNFAKEVIATDAVSVAAE
jgi:hypothetical protein